MSKLWTFGCSFTAEYHPVDSMNGHKNNYVLYKEWLGGELPDTWPTKLGKLLQFDVENKGVGGASNDHIFGTFCDNCDSISKGDIVIIGWTQIARFWIGTYDEKQLPKFMSVLPNMNTNIDPNSTYMTSDTLDFLLVERTNRLYVEEIYYRESIIEELAKNKGFEVFFWSSDNKIIYKESKEFKNKKKYLCSESDEQIISYLIRKKNAKDVKLETKGLIKDCHYGEIGHRVQSEVFYKEISEKLKPKLI